MNDMSASGWNGRQLVDSTGRKIGTVQDVYFDDAMEHPQWLVVKLGLFGTTKVYVPAKDVRSDEDKLIVPYTQERVKKAPHAGREQIMSGNEEMQLHTYYGLEHPETSVPGGADVIGAGKGQQ